MKNIRKIFCVFLIISLFISVPVLNASGIENKGFDDQFKDIGNESKGRICDYDGTEILKEVSQEPDKDGNYEITLTVKGKPKKVTKPVDILLIMDASNSMYYNMDELKASMNSLVDKVIDNIPDSRIAVVAFGTYSEEVFSFNNKNNFTSKEEYKKAIKKSYNNIEGRGNTNIESSWRLADEIFKNELNNNFNSKKDVIFFSDGYPNESMNMLLESKYLEGGREYYEQYKKHLEQIYKTKIKKDSDYEKILMDELNNGNYKSIDEWALYEYEKFYNNYPDTNIFSVALIDNIPYEDKNSAKELLSKMQNSGYFTIDSRFGQDNNENNR